MSLSGWRFESREGLLFSSNKAIVSLPAQTADPRRRWQTVMRAHIAGELSSGMVVPHPSFSGSVLI